MRSFLCFRRFAVVACALLVAFATQSARAQCLIGNGGFETGDFALWTQVGTIEFTAVSGPAARSGAFGAGFGPVGGLGGIKQVVSVPMGTMITISYWLRIDGNTPSEFQVTLGGVALENAINPAATGGFQFRTFTVAAPVANPELQFLFRNVPGFFDLDDVTVGAAGLDACCDVSGGCIVVLGACPAGSAAQAVPNSCCSPNYCPQPTACCHPITGVCTISPPGTVCPVGLVASGTTCAPSPCVPGSGLSCDDCTYTNGVANAPDGQLSHLGGASPHGAKAADDLYLCENFVYDLRTFTATLFTTTFPGLVKPKGEIWSDCGGCPGELLYTFDNPLVVETGADIGPAFDGRPLRVVHATFDVTRETNIVNKNVVLKGGRYWLSIYGQSDNLGPSMGMYDITYWGVTAGYIKGKPAHKVDGNAGNAYNVFTFPSGCGPAAWHSVADDCCIGCTDLNFSFCTAPCKVLVDNGPARVQVGGQPNGSTSQFAGDTLFNTRSADDFLTPPCQVYRICYAEACVLTNCTTFEGIFEIYVNNCNKPSYALGGLPAGNLQWIATKIIPLGPTYQSIIDGKTLQGYRLEFHDLNFTLQPGVGQQWWVSFGVRYSFSASERAYFCYNQPCGNQCSIKWNDGRVLTLTTLDAEAAAAGCVSPAPVVGCNGWAKTGNDFSFLIAADGLTTPGPINGQPGQSSCAADFNADGSLTPQDVFDYLNAFFSGCP